MPQTKSALEAAKLVLEQAREPLRYEEITRRILDQDLWRTTGKTPAATLSARLSQSVKILGAASPFVHTDPGCYALNPAPTPAAASKAAFTSKPKIKAAPSTAIPAPAPASKSLSFTDAAERVLECSASKQLHYRDITRLALDQHLVDTSGKRAGTPARRENGKSCG